MDHDPVTNIESLGWNDLVLLKRKFSASIREVTQEIIDIDNNKLPRVNQEIHEQKIGLNGSVVKSRKNRLGIQSANSDLLALSEKIHQSKNFLGMMHGRLPQEKVESLMHIAKFNESLINGGKYSSAREKDQILFVSKGCNNENRRIKGLPNNQGSSQQQDTNAKSPRNRFERWMMNTTQYKEKFFARARLKIYLILSMRLLRNGQIYYSNTTGYPSN